MKKSILFLSILTSILIFSIISCSKSNEDNTTDKTTTISGEVIYGLKVGLLDEPNNEIVLENSIEAFKSALVSENIFDSIVEVAATRGYDPIEGKFKSFLTIMGKEGVNVIALQYGLDVTDGNIVYLSYDPEVGAKSETTHTCSGNGCSSCLFTTTASY